jgi:23S rRNA pseudouridine1911/1915/1917 synthase
MEKEFDIIVEESLNERLDAYLALKLAISRSQVEKYIQNGLVQVNHADSKPSYRVKKDDRIIIHVPEASPIKATAQEMPLDVIFEDKDIIVINKQRGVVVHPAPGHSDKTLVNALLFHCKDLSGIGGNVRPGVVHRLDKDTSGLLVFAKNDVAHLDLSRQIKDRTVKKKYLALVFGNVKADSGVINEPLGRNPSDRKKIAVIRNDQLKRRDAVTLYKVVKRFNGYTLLECDLKTGRTHQIRVHLAHIGHPIVGDDTYSRKRASFWREGQFLHAYKLEFNHPVTGKTMFFEAKLPNDMEEVLKGLSAE